MPWSEKGSRKVPHTCSRFGAWPGSDWTPTNGYTWRDDARGDPDFDELKSKARDDVDDRCRLGWIIKDLTTSSSNDKRKER